MKKLIKKIADLISIDYRYTKGFQESDVLIQNQILLVHNIVLFLTCILAGVFYIDYGYLNSLLSLGVIDYFDWDIRFKNEVLEGDILAFYFGVTVFNFLISVLFAVYFYCKYGHKQKRIDILGLYYWNEIFSTILSMTIRLVLIVMFLFGGVLFSMTFLKPFYWSQTASQNYAL